MCSVVVYSPPEARGTYIAEAHNDILHSRNNFKLCDRHLTHGLSRPTYEFTVSIHILPEQLEYIDIVRDQYAENSPTLLDHAFMVRMQKELSVERKVEVLLRSPLPVELVRMVFEALTLVCE